MDVSARAVGVGSEDGRDLRESDLGILVMFQPPVETQVKGDCLVDSLKLEVVIVFLEQLRRVLSSKERETTAGTLGENLELGFSGLLWLAVLGGDCLHIVALMTRLSMPHLRRRSFCKQVHLY